MRLVVAVGGNALLERGDVPLAEIQEAHVRVAVDALAPLAKKHDLVITHGNGPQVGLLANESALDPDLPIPYPFDVLGAQTQGMIGYFFLQAFENALPGRAVASLVCQTEVDAQDPAFSAPTKFVGLVYSETDARRLAELRGWQVRRDGMSWRRVVASPEPLAMLELGTIRSLLDAGAVVICAGGGGIPVVRDSNGTYKGAEAVIDKDLSAALLACDLSADALLILTDVANVMTGLGTEHARPIGHTTPSALRAEHFPAGSMGPKIEAACRFVESTGKRAIIGRLVDAAALLYGTCGTVVESEDELGRDARRKHVGRSGRDGGDPDTSSAVVACCAVNEGDQPVLGRQMDGEVLVTPGATNTARACDGPGSARVEHRSDQGSHATCPAASSPKGPWLTSADSPPP